MRVIAHRGGRGFGTDNTLQAMEEAVRAGVRSIETDVRATADGRLLICHDAMIWGHVVRRTTFDEIRRVAPERPLLSDVLEHLAGWVTFNIEIKEAAAADVAEMLDRHGIAMDTTVTSFDHDIVRDYKAALPSAVTGLLYRNPYGAARRVKRTLELGCSILAPHFHSIDRGLVDEAHRAGLQVYAWTVNDETDFRKLAGWGVDGVITDRYFQVKGFLDRIRAERA